MMMKLVPDELRAMVNMTKRRRNKVFTRMARMTAKGNQRRRRLRIEPPRRGVAEKIVEVEVVGETPATVRETHALLG